MRGKWYEITKEKFENEFIFAQSINRTSDENSEVFVLYYYSFTNPNYVPFYSKLSGLPAENIGAFLLRGNVKIGDLIGFGKVAPAARLVGTLGELPELKIPSSFIKPLTVATKAGKVFKLGM